MIHIVAENGGPALASSHLFLFAGVINAAQVLELLLVELSEPPLPCLVIVLLVDDLAQSHELGVIDADQVVPALRGC